MNRPTLLHLVVSAAFLFVAASRAQAEFLRLDTVIVPDPVGTPPNTFNCQANLGVSVCRLYATFDAPYPANKLLSVGNAAISSNAPAGFYQHSFGFGNTSPLIFVFPMYPDLVCDSFVTFGLEYNYGSDGTAVDPAFSQDCFDNIDDPPPAPTCAAGEVVGGWYNSNVHNTQGNPVETSPGVWQVLIAQFTVEEGYHVAGTVDLFYFLEDQIDYYSSTDQYFQCVAAEPCPVDLDADGSVGETDLAILLAAWGPNPGHPADFNLDGTVSAADLAVVLGNWGPC